MNARPRTLPKMDAKSEPLEEDSIEQGKRLIRVGDDRGLSLAERLANGFYRLTWNTPLHAMRLKGKYPLKLLALPREVVPGDARAGKALRAGYFLYRGMKQQVAGIDYRKIDQADDFADYIHRFRWLADLAAATALDGAVPVAEAQMRAWLAAHHEKPSEPAWRADNAGWRILYWATYSPLILSSGDLVYRSLVLNCIARTARHLDRSADKAPVGLPRVTAWAGIIAAGLLLPGGDGRQIFGEAGLKRALEAAFSADGGIISRSPQEQLEAIHLLSMLAAVYDVRRKELPGSVADLLERVVAAMLGILHGDGGVGNWQGGAWADPARITSIVAASGVRTRPLRQARDWGYQRLAAGQTVVQVDAAPPPVARLARSGCASTCALEVSDGPVRLIVNCGGAALTGSIITDDLAQALRSTAAHSTLVLNDSNSTAIQADGSLGKGVVEVELDRQELEQGSRLEVGHDGYAKRLGFLHKRLILLSTEGRELRGEDMLLPVQRRRRIPDAPFSLRFHLGPDVEPTLTADRQGALLRLATGALWQFRVGAGELVLEDSLWVDGEGRPHPTQQLVVTGTAGGGGSSIGWLLKRSG
ncbi:MAG: heparinase II/III family protein [Sphingobium sp.]|nr:heparinase II/III family protein [Sphingobium sp.]